MKKLTFAVSYQTNNSDHLLRRNYLMEENNKLQQNHSGNTPPPVPQPAPPPLSWRPMAAMRRVDRMFRNLRKNRVLRKKSLPPPRCPREPCLRLHRWNVSWKRPTANLRPSMPNPCPMRGFSCVPSLFKGRITRAEYLISYALIPFHFMLVAYVANVASEMASFLYRRGRCWQSLQSPHALLRPLHVLLVLYGTRREALP